MPTIFLRLLQHDDKEAVLRAAIDAANAAIRPRRCSTSVRCRSSKCPARRLPIG
jgi:hypothetical protein